MKKKPNSIYKGYKRLLSFLLFVCLWMPSFAGMQNGKVNLQMSSVSVQEVIEEIANQTDIGFLYRGEELKSQMIDKVDFQGIEWEEVLNEILDPIGKTFKVEKDLILIVDKPEEVKKVTEEEQQQRGSINGKVTDKDGNPLPGVSVVIKGTSIGVATDIDGNYTMEWDSQDNFILVYSFVGLLPQEVEYKGQSVQNITLLMDSETMDEVLVTGYQTISRERTSGSFVSIKGDQLVETQTSDNVLDVLSGQVAGLLIDDTGSERNQKITLRGENNFGGVNGDEDGNVAPLLVVDGVPYVGAGVDLSVNPLGIIDNINPNDIESINFLKDASAASIYGAQAANGVIVVTTKKGAKADKPSITLNSSFSLTQKPDYSTRFQASKETNFELDEFAVDNNFYQFSSWDIEAQRGSESKEAYLGASLGWITEAERDDIVNELRNHDGIGEYTDLFLRNSFQQQHNLSISHAKEKFSYYTSFNYRNNKSFEKGDESEYFGTNFNVSSEILKGVRFNTRLNFSKDFEKNNGIGSVTQTSLFERILDENGNYRPQAGGLHPQQIAIEDARGVYPYDWDYNMKREYDNKDNKFDRTKVDFTGKLDFDIIKGLTGEVIFNYQYGRMDHKDLMNEEMSFTRNRVNNAVIFENTGYDANWNPILDFYSYGIPKGSIFNKDYIVNSSKLIRGQLNYNGYFDKDEKHHVTAIAGAERREEKYKNKVEETLYGYDSQALSSTTIDFINPLYTPSWNAKNLQFRGWNSNLATPNADLHKDRNRYISMYSNFGYTYNGKYTLTGSWRLDDSNLFGSSDKYRNVPLWSTGIKWRMAEENFMSFDFLDMLDVRASIGTGGRINKGSSPFLTAFLGSQSNPNYSYAGVRTHENQELRWEKTRTINLGVDFAMFNHRLSGTLEYYNKNTSDVMGQASTDPTWGHPSQFRNYAEISNKGFEMALNYNAIQNKEWRWNINFNLSHNKNKVEKVDAARSVGLLVGGGYTEGNPLSGFYAYRWAGLSEQGAPQVYNENDEVVDYTTEIIDESALTYVGQFTPKVFGGLTNSFSWKGFKLDIMLEYRFGHKFRRYAISSSDFGNSRSLPVHIDHESRWQEEGHELTTNIPAWSPNAVYNPNYLNYYRSSDMMVEDASHIRLRNIGLNYQVNQELLKNTFIKGASVGVNARNLGILWSATDYDIDPEVGNGPWAYKRTPTYSLNLRVNF